MTGVFSGVRVFEVAPGTVVGKDSSGKDVVVTDTEAVFNGPSAWMTPRQYALLKAKIK